MRKNRYIKPWRKWQTMKKRNTSPIIADIIQIKKVKTKWRSVLIIRTVVLIACWAPSLLDKLYPTIFKKNPFFNTPSQSCCNLHAFSFFYQSCSKLCGILVAKWDHFQNSPTSESWQSNAEKSTDKPCCRKIKSGDMDVCLGFQLFLAL